MLEAMPAIMAAVPEARLVIVGQGPLEAELHAQAADLGLDVTWLPFEAPASCYLRGFDVYVLSSAWEAFPIGVLEAQACGVPQVGSAAGGTPESVVPETGIIVPPRDPVALATAVTQLLRDPQRRADMSEASRARHAEHFTVERMVALDKALTEMLVVAQRFIERGAENDMMFVAVFSTLIYLWRGEFHDAQVVSDETVERAEQLGGDHMHVIAMTVRAAVASYRGREREAREAGEAALEVAQQCGSPRLADWSTFSLGFLEVSLGNYAKALERLQPLVARFDDVPGTRIPTSVGREPLR